MITTNRDIIYPIFVDTDTDIKQVVGHVVTFSFTNKIFLSVPSSLKYDCTKCSFGDKTQTIYKCKLLDQNIKCPKHSYFIEI